MKPKRIAEIQPDTEPTRPTSKGVVVPSSVEGYVGVRLDGLTYLVLADRVDEFLAAWKAS